MSKLTIPSYHLPISSTALFLREIEYIYTMEQSDDGRMIPDESMFHTAHENNEGAGDWEMGHHLEEEREKPPGRHYDYDYNESGTSLTLTADMEEDDRKPCFGKCGVKECLVKTAMGTLVTAIIVGLAYILEPGYAEINMYTPLSHELCMQYLNESLSNETMAVIEGNPFSPQAMALEWMDNDPKLNSYPLWRHQQRFALVTLYYSFNGVLWPEEKMGHWLSYKKSECEWIGSGPREKFCTKYFESRDTEWRFERLILNDIVNFRGSMPLEISHLIYLYEISVTRMTDQAFTLDDLLPQDEATMARLNKLDFYKTRLEGTIPNETISWAMNMTEINFSDGGSLSGEVPTSLGLLDNLQTLNLKGNQLSGSLPKTIASLPSLQHLSLQKNDFTGEIPLHWCTMRILISLHIDHNHLEGAIPVCLSNIRTLEAFTYEGNQLIAP